MLLAVSFLEVKDWAELIAAIVTILAALGGAASILHYFKNRFGKKSFRTILEIERIDEYEANLTFLCKLRFENRTNKEFSVIDCAIIYESAICPVVEYKRTSHSFDFPVTEPIPLHDIAVEAHDSITFSPVYFDLKKLQLKRAKLRVRNNRHAELRRHIAGEKFLTATSRSTNSSGLSRL